MRAIIESEWMMKNRKIVNRLFDDKKLEQFAETKCNSINRDSLMKTCKKKNHKKYRTLEEEDFDKLESANLAKNLTSKKLSLLRAKENNTHQIN